jgi:plastocyanin
MMKSYIQMNASVGLCASLIFCLTVFVPAVAGRTDLWSLADLNAAPADAALPGTEVDAEPGALAIVKVSMRNMQFSPKTLRVKKGTVVEWQNDDVVPHTATSSSFDSGSLGRGQSWRHTFTAAGRFQYTCTFHPLMTGTIIVK